MADPGSGSSYGGAESALPPRRLEVTHQAISEEVVGTGGSSGTGAGAGAATPRLYQNKHDIAGAVDKQDATPQHQHRYYDTSPQETYRDNLGPMNNTGSGTRGSNINNNNTYGAKTSGGSYFDDNNNNNNNHDENPVASGLPPSLSPEPRPFRDSAYQSPQLVSESSHQAAAGSFSRLPVLQRSHGSGHGNYPTSSINVTSGLPLRTAKTFVRPQPPQELLANPSIRNIHVRASISVSAPLHNSGSKVAGILNIKVRNNPKGDDVRLGRISIDLLGVEAPTSSNDNERSFFRLQPSRGSIPFVLQLPSDIGPGSFYSAKARIRYIFHATLLLSANGERKLVRCCRDINIIPLLDLQTILRPLEVPLVASEEKSISATAPGLLTITASLQRSIWISGSMAYVDVSIQNQTIITIKNVRLKLVRHVLSYKTSIAQSAERPIGYIRAPSWLWRKTVSRSELNVGTRWRGLKGGANEDESLTCEIEVPRDEISVPMGRYFEVKYFIDIAASTRFSKRERVRVQLPITIVHMNSIDSIVLSRHMYSVDELGLSKSKSRNSASQTRPCNSIASSEHDRSEAGDLLLQKHNSQASKFSFRPSFTVDSPNFENFVSNADKDIPHYSVREGKQTSTR